MISIVRIMRNNTSSSALVNLKTKIDWIQKRLIDVEQKIKKNQQVIETKTTFTGDRPKGILDRIIAIQQDI